VAASTSSKQANHVTRPFHSQARGPFQDQVRKRRARFLPTGGPGSSRPEGPGIAALWLVLPTLTAVALRTFPELYPPDDPCAVVREAHIRREADLDLGRVPATYVTVIVENKAF